LRVIRLFFVITMMFTVLSPQAEASCDWTYTTTAITTPCVVAIGQSSPALTYTQSKTLTVVSPTGWAGRGILELGSSPGANEAYGGRYTAAIEFVNLRDGKKESAAIFVQASNTANADGNRGYSMQFFTKPDGDYYAAERLRIDAVGNVGIGTSNPTAKLDVAGNVKVSGTLEGGNIRAHLQDLAEWVPATTDLAPGTVVILNPARTNEVMASVSSYDSTVAGVVSAGPGVLLGHGGSSKEMIATTGRVKVRVDATVHPVKIGDLLVTSDKPGTAMRSQPLMLEGVAIHRPGTIIGKALEPLAAGEAEILVLLSLQ